MPGVPYANPYVEYAGFQFNYNDAFLDCASQYNLGGAISSFNTASVSSLNVSSINGAVPGTGGATVSSFNTLSASSLTVSSINGLTIGGASSNVFKSSQVLPLTVLAATHETLTLSAEIDPNSWWDSGTSSFKPTIAGYYFLSAQLTINPSIPDTSQLQLRIVDNTGDISLATTALEGFSNPANSETMTATALYYFDGITTNVSAKVYNDTAGTITVATGPGLTTFQAFLIGGSPGPAGPPGSTISTFNTATISSLNVSSINGEVPGSGGGVISSIYGTLDFGSTINIITTTAMGSSDIQHFSSGTLTSYLYVDASIGAQTDVGNLTLRGAKGQVFQLLSDFKDAQGTGEIHITTDPLQANNKIEIGNGAGILELQDSLTGGGIQLMTSGASNPPILIQTPTTGVYLATSAQSPATYPGIFLDDTRLCFNNSNLLLPSQALQNTLNIVPFPSTAITPLYWSTGTQSTMNVPIAADTSITYIRPISTINVGETGWRFTKTYDLIVPVTRGLSTGSTYTIVSTGSVNWQDIGGPVLHVPGTQFTYNGSTITGNNAGTCTSSKKISWYTLNDLYGLSLPKTNAPTTAFRKSALQNAWFLVKFNADFAMQGNLAIQIDTYAYQHLNSSNAYTGRWAYSFPLQQGVGFTAGALTNIITSNAIPRLRAGFTYLLYAGDNAPSVAPAASQYLPEGAGLFAPSQVSIEETLRNPYDIYTQFPHFGMTNCLYSSNAVQPTYGNGNAYSDPGAVEVASIYLNTSSTAPFSGVGQTVIDFNVLAMGYSGIAGSNVSFNYSNVWV
jgi:hypothetical protein